MKLLIAWPDDDHPVPGPQAKDLFDLRLQVLHVVAVALLAEPAEMVEVLPDL